MSIAVQRLMSERKNWRKEKPFRFFATPTTNSDGSLNLMKWNCGIPGKEGVGDFPIQHRQTSRSSLSKKLEQQTNWDGAIYPLTFEFTEEYPSKPPKCRFSEGFFHPNVYPSGTVCLSILNEDDDWKPSITIKQILLGIQDLLDAPNPNSPAQQDAYFLFVKDRDQYNKRVLEQARRYSHND